jgi:hypothetical protein
MMNDATEGTSRVPLDLFGFLSMEEHQILVSFSKAREEVDLLTHMEGLYTTAVSFRNVAEDDFVIFQLLTFTHYHFLFALACQMRCHLSEAYASARTAIDAALIAAYIIRDRSLQVAYAKREPHPLIPTLFQQHKKISTFASHADVSSFVHRVRKSTTDDNQVMMNVDYFQFAREDTERKIHTLGLFHTFVMVLDVFSDFLIAEQKVVPPEWQKELHALGQYIERRAKELRPAASENADDST